MQTLWQIYSLRALCVFAEFVIVLLAPMGAGIADPIKPALIWGVNGHPFQDSATKAYHQVSITEQLHLVKTLGVTSYRVDVLDARAVPRLKALVREAGALGIDILPVITPRFSLNRFTPSELYDMAFTLAVALIAPLKNEIRVWELGNEMENYAIIKGCEYRDNGQQYDCAWGPAGGLDPLDYYGPRWGKVSAVLKGLSEGAKSVDPSIKRAMGTAGWGHIGAFSRMQADSIDWDISVWHMYGQDPEWAFKILADFGRPIWVTEFNHPGGSMVSAESQAQGLVKWMKRLSELASEYRLEAAHIYELMDQPYWAPSYEATMGLVTFQHTPAAGWHAGPTKLAFSAIRDLLSETQGLQPNVQRAAWPNVRKGFLPDRHCSLNALGKAEKSSESRVSYAYCLILGRVPDDAGRNFWLSKLRKPIAIGEMLKQMIASDEFRMISQIDNLEQSDFISLLYRGLLMREPDGAGLTSYIEALESGKISREAMIVAFLQSEEFAARHPILVGP